MGNSITINEVENLIEVRSEPHIYVFSTNTIPNYVKVGDTFRPIATRLGEWQEIYKDLQRLFPDINNELEALAKVNDDIYFRDYAIHTYLTNNGYHRLEKDELIEEIGEEVYFSNEFFKNVPVEIVKKGIQEVKEGYESKNPNYNYYKISDKQTIDTHWNNDKEWKLRENQEVVVNNFCDKVETEKELLMYAVMRFGKSFTAISCAKAKNYKKILVVSAKADVATEWKKTVEMPKCFSEYAFLCDKNFADNANIIEDVLNQKSAEFKEKNAVVVFLTLQNLTGKDSCGNNIKKKLEQAYNEIYDMIIIDETHYGAWAESYGKPLNNKEEDEDVIKEGLKELDKFNEQSNKLRANVRLHLSGTPYNLLYENKFTQKNIIATCQFSDILKDKEKWYNEHKKDIDAGEYNPETGLPYEEYDNPYYGFPKMLRFAFNLPEEIQANLIKRKPKYTLNDLLLTNKQEDTKFIYEEDVLKLLKAIDGKETDERVLSFLNVPKIKDNKVCKHIVMVLPYKYSCDAMESLLTDNKDNFINLGEYKVLNITGHKTRSELDSVEKVKEAIKEYEQQGEKTITLTVNKMLTGVTVPEWDTMIMLKNTKSAQEYDQAVFRIQNQYVKEVETTDNSGNKRIAKIDMKPQTILVDFDPIRMFEIQGLSARIVNDINEENIDLDEALETELNFFPIITYNATELVQVTPTNIVEVIANYNKNISILEASEKAVLDENMLLDASILEYIKKQSDKGISSGLKGNMHESNDKSKVDMPQDDDGAGDNTGVAEPSTDNSNQNQDNDSRSNKEIKELKLKYKKCIARLMFYTFLTNTNVSSVKDVLRSVEEPSEYQEENIRIFDNLELDLPFLKAHVEKCRKTFSFEIDSLLEQANLLSKDESLTKEEQAKNALARFSRISESEVVTPNEICDEMYGTIGIDGLIDIVSNNGKILDIASKTGEFTFALYQLLKDKVGVDKIKKSIYCIPTSNITYEFTKKIYEILEFPLDHVAKPPLTSYGLLQHKKKDEKGQDTKELDYEKIRNLIEEAFKEGENEVKFEAVVGNPPYQSEVKKSSETNGQNPRTNIFQHFQIQAEKMAQKYSVLIFPGVRWIHQSGKGLKEFGKQLINSKNLKKIIFYPKSKDVFDCADISDGVSIVAIDKAKDSSNFDYEYITSENKISLTQTNPNNDLLLINPKDLSIANKIKQFVTSYNLSFLHGSILSRSLFGIESDFIENNSSVARKYVDGEALGANEIKVLTNDKAGPAGRSGWFVIDKSLITNNSNYIDEWQVVVSSAHPGGQEGRDNQISIIDNCSAFGRARVALKSFKTEEEAQNFYKYANCSIIKYAFLLSHESLSSLAKFVPDLLDYTSNNTIIDLSKTTEEINKQIYDKCRLTEEEISFIESIIKPME